MNGRRRRLILGLEIERGGIDAIAHAPAIARTVGEDMAEVPAAWAQGDELVGAGVTLATQQPLPGKPFKKMSKKLPLLDKPGQLRGLATSIGCYDDLTRTVRRYAWTAL